MSPLKVMIAFTAGVTVIALAETSFGQDRYDAFLRKLPVFEPMGLRDPRRPQFCLQLADQAPCPVATLPAGPMGIGAQFRAHLPNAEANLFIDEIFHEPVEGGGIDDESLLVTWTTSGSEADFEAGGPYGWPAPSPGDSSSGPSLFAAPIYRALIVDGCETLASFPVSHAAAFAVPGQPTLGTFSGSDATTVDGPGYYQVFYTVFLENGGQSARMHISGRLIVTCSAADTL